jgi:hypothetical protein
VRRDRVAMDAVALLAKPLDEGVIPDGQTSRESTIGGQISSLA